MKLLLRFLKPHWKLCLLTVVLLFVDVAGSLFIPTLVAEMLNAGTSGAAFQSIVTTGIQMAVISAVAGLGAIAGGYACATLTAQVAKDMRQAIYTKSLKLSVYDFRQFGTASITTRTISDVTTIQMALLSSIQMILPVPVICVLSLVLTFNLNRAIGFVLLAVVLVVLILAFFMIRTAFTNYAQTSIRANRRFANLDGLSFFFINFFVVLIYWMSGGQIHAGLFQIGDITAVIEYALLVLFYLMMAQMVILTLPRALECCERIRLVLDHSPEITDLVLDDPEEKGDEKDVLTFQDVSFRFADAEEYTLRNLNFTCRRGETTAIIGGTGSGKSTVASLILRFHDATEGALLLNGTDIRQMTQQFLRDHLSYVQQKAWLFSGTIADNLRYSRKNATEEELMHAADVAGLDDPIGGFVAQAGDFIRSLPNGLNSYVAQGGTNFSGGQKQRLSIARALVKKPELYIFDDSFSALDFKTDAALRKALAAETQDAAVLIIAQRVSSIRHAHQIVVLDEGAVAGIGTHEELMETCTVYQEIYESQTKEAQEA